MEINTFGYLKIRVFTASEAFPVSNAIVRIYGNEESNGGIEYSVKTNRQGVTEIIKLPAPSASLSQSPNSPMQSYSTYNVEIHATEFYPKTIIDVAVFSGILSILPVEMIPDAGLRRDTPQPTTSNKSIINENEELS